MWKNYSEEFRKLFQTITLSNGMGSFLRMTENSAIRQKNPEYQ